MDFEKLIAIKDEIPDPVLRKIAEQMIVKSQKLHSQYKSKEEEGIQMKKFDIGIKFANGESQVKKSESNDNITAMNLALNRLTPSERSNVINISITCVSE